MGIKQEDLIPPDLKQCQASPNMLEYNPWSLGGGAMPPVAIRCGNKPKYVAVEIVAGSDGLYGSMSLCEECSKLMMRTDLKERVQINEIDPKEWGNESTEYGSD